MTNTNEFDIRLRAFTNVPDDFLDDVALVDVLHNNPVLASDQPCALEIDGQKVTPVFSDKDDLETFKAEQDSALQQNWVERSTLDVLREVIEEESTGLVFNLKETDDFDNSTIFKSSELIRFLNAYTTTLNKLVGEENLAANVLDKYYLVSAFVHPRDDKSFDRVSPTVSTPEDESYMLAFSSLQSFTKWYNHNDFGLPFRKVQGSVLTWRLADIYQPGRGEDDIDETVGAVISPFDDQQILVDWSDTDEDE